MNEDVEGMDSEAAQAEILKHFKEFELGKITIEFTLCQVDGQDKVVGEVLFYDKVPHHGTFNGLAKQEFVDYKGFDRLEKLILYHGDVEV